MIKIMFVCHGNICRSPMAEFLMKDLVGKEGNSDKFLIKSSATSFEEEGNPVHYGTRKILLERKISCEGKRATKLFKGDYDKYDYFVCMDSYNFKNMLNIFGGDRQNKCYKLLDFTDNPRDVADPYWTGDFTKTVSDVEKGVSAFYEFLKAQNKL